MSAGHAAIPNLGPGPEKAPHSPPQARSVGVFSEPLILVHLSRPRGIAGVL